MNQDPMSVCELYQSIFQYDRHAGRRRVELIAILAAKTHFATFGHSLLDCEVFEADGKAWVKTPSAIEKHGFWPAIRASRPRPNFSQSQSILTAVEGLKDHYISELEQLVSDWVKMSAE